MDATGEEERHPIGIDPFRFSDPSVARRGQALVWLNHQLDTVSEGPQSIGQAHRQRPRPPVGDRSALTRIGSRSQRTGLH